MIIYKKTIDAIIFVRQSNLTDKVKQSKIIDLENQGIAKIHDTIIIVDEYGLLD